MAPLSTSASLLHQTLGDIVTADPRAATVFDRFGLDYCCHGYQTLEDAAAGHGIPVPNLLTDLDALGPIDPREHATVEWTNLDALTTHIVRHHHDYVRSVTPVIQGWLRKLVARHGERHPELKDVRTAFGTLADEMATHMVKEENLLFPFIDALATAGRSTARLPAGPFGTILNPIRMMEEDHQHAGDALARLRALTNDYTPPDGACATYRRCYAELANYESDLHRHVHLENNVLFPGAVELEGRLA